MSKDVQLPAATEAAAIAELALRGASTPQQIETKDGRLLIVLPTDRVVQDLSDPARVRSPGPHIRQALTLQTLDSLVGYANRFKTDDTVMFADIDQNSISAAIDYHGPQAPAHGHHTARMHLPFSVEWKAWAAIDGKYMDQLSFARFLEENAADISAPTGADLLEVCRDLQARRTVDFRKAVRTNTDNESFEFTDETTATSRKSGDAIEIPSKFQLSIPVYFGESNQSLFAFLRWKLDDGKLSLGVQLHRAEHVRQAVFKQIVLTAADAIDRPAVFGRLEAASSMLGGRV